MVSCKRAFEVLRISWVVHVCEWTCLHGNSLPLSLSLLSSTSSERWWLMCTPMMYCWEDLYLRWIFRTICALYAPSLSLHATVRYVDWRELFAAVFYNVHLSLTYIHTHTYAHCPLNHDWFHFYHRMSISDYSSIPSIARGSFYISSISTNTQYTIRVTGIFEIVINAELMGSKEWRIDFHFRTNGQAKDLSFFFSVQNCIFHYGDFRFLRFIV